MAFDVHHVLFSNVAVWAQSRVYAILQHIKTVIQQELAKLRSGFALSFSVGRQIEKYRDPHDFI